MPGIKLRGSEMTEEQENKHVGWRGFDASIYSLAERIDEPDIVVGVARGGLPGATMLSHALDCDLATIKVEHYEGDEKQDDVTVGPLYGVHGGADVLIFDEKVGTGATMEAVRKEVERQTTGVIETASIHVDPDRDFDPDYWLEETEKWVVYPWEVSL